MQSEEWEEGIPPESKSGCHDSLLVVR